MSKILNDDLAYSVFMNKYAAPNETLDSDMHKRLAKELARIEFKYVQKSNKFFNRVRNLKKLSSYGAYRSRMRRNVSERHVYFDILHYLLDFRYIVPQGSIMSMLGRKDKIGSLSNCFVVGQPYDSYGGILNKDEQLAQLMKRRGGVGIDISTLRPEDSKVTNAAGSSTGAASFMERYSNTTREVAQKGRRGALMITIDVRHPDVFSFVNMKQDRTKVTGANISVMLRDDFMKAVKEDTEYILRWPCDLPPEKAEITKTIKAKELYDQIVFNAWDNAEPGQMFIDRHWDYSPDTVYPQYKGVTTNP